MIHELKTWPLFFSQIQSGVKTFEVRKNDRCFIEGDELLLKEFNPANDHYPNGSGEYTGRILHRKITSILKGSEFGIMEGYIVLSLQKV